VESCLASPRGYIEMAKRRALWTCKSERWGKETDGYEWTSRGRLFTYSGCGKVNLYISKSERDVKVIDIQCKYCSRRVQFHPHRQSNRGKMRPIHWMPADPSDSTAQLIEKMSAANGSNAHGFKNLAREE